MSLTTEQVNRLTEPFPANEHEWFNSMAYVDEMAVSTRLEEIDPSWEFVRVHDPIYGENRVTIFMRMTVCGVTREDAGTSKLTGKKKDGTVFIIDEPEKGALTDALRRCARRFGIGRYLTILPNGVNNEAALEKWLSAYFGMPASVATGGQNQSPQTGHDKTPVSTSETPQMGKFWDGDLPALFAAVYENLPNVSYQERTNTVNKMVQEGKIAQGMKMNECIAAVMQRIQEHHPEIVF